MNASELKNKFGDRLMNHEVARRHLSLAVGGVADYFLEIFTINDLMTAVNICCQNQIPFRVVGSGSLILISDYGYPGLIIKNSSANISVLPGTNKVIVDSGVSVPRWLTFLANNGIGGLEFLYGEKGTVGGAIYNNKRGYSAGSGSQSISINSYLKKIILMTPRGEAVARNSAWLKTDCPLTKIKQQAVKSVILTAIFQLYQSRQEDIVRKMNEVIKPKKADNVISGDIFYDLGSRNVNEIIKNAKMVKIKEKKIELCPDYPNRLMVKGKDISANEIRVYIEKVRQAVFDATSIMLKENIEYLGQW